ncbi:MAG: hypothetical protein GVY30_08260 [Chloroflexi bacterium]|jgi:hypothetical protein|nr:hypothetical protein [Chloroflexota bacterium]
MDALNFEFDTMMWLYIGGGAIILVVVAALWRKLLRAAMILVGLGIALALAWTLAMQATATKEVATAATVSAAGSTAGNVGMMILAFLLFVATIAGGTYIFLLRRRIQTLYNSPDDAWLPGSNAQWGRTGPTAAPGDALGALIQIEVLRALRELRADRGAALAPYDAWDEAEDAGEQPYTEPDPMWWR